jgi:hypothetical protein
VVEMNLLVSRRRFNPCFCWQKRLQTTGTWIWPSNGKASYLAVYIYVCIAFLIFNKGKATSRVVAFAHIHHNLYIVLRNECMFHPLLLLYECKIRVPVRMNQLHPMGSFSTWLPFGLASCCCCCCCPNERIRRDEEYHDTATPWRQHQ